MWNTLFLKSFMPGIIHTDRSCMNSLSSVICSTNSNESFMGQFTIPGTRKGLVFLMSNVPSTPYMALCHPFMLLNGKHENVLVYWYVLMSSWMEKYRLEKHGLLCYLFPLPPCTFRVQYSFVVEWNQCSVFLMHYMSLFLLGGGES